MTAPVTPATTIVPGGPDHTLLRRVMKIRATDRHTERIILADTVLLRLSLRDTGSGDTAPETATRPTAVHLLWARNEEAARLLIEDRDTPIAPGDTVILPTHTVWQASAGLILCEIRSTSTAAPDHVIGPTHGTDAYHGYNRETIFPPLPGLVISRWKITQPLLLPPPHDERFIVPVAAPLTLLWPGGVDLVRPGACRLLPSGCDPVTILPDGVAYMLAVSTTPPPAYRSA